MFSVDAGAPESHYAVFAFAHRLAQPVELLTGTKQAYCALGLMTGQTMTLGLSPGTGVPDCTLSHTWPKAFTSAEIASLTTPRLRKVFEEAAEGTNLRRAADPTDVITGSRISGVRVVARTAEEIEARQAASAAPEGVEARITNAPLNLMNDGTASTAASLSPDAASAATNGNAAEEPDAAQRAHAAAAAELLRKKLVVEEGGDAAAAVAGKDNKIRPAKAQVDSGALLDPFDIALFSAPLETVLATRRVLVNVHLIAASNVERFARSSADFRWVLERTPKQSVTGEAVSTLERMQLAMVASTSGALMVLLKAAAWVARMVGTKEAEEEFFDPNLVRLDVVGMPNDLFRRRWLVHKELTLELQADGSWRIDGVQLHSNVFVVPDATPAK